MKPALKHQNQNTNLLKNINCHEKYIARSNICRNIHGNIIADDADQCKCKIILCGTGDMPNVQVTQKFEIESSIRTYMQISSGYQLDDNLKFANDSLFFQNMDSHDITKIENTSEIPDLGNGQLSYRSIFNVVASNISIKHENFKPEWEIEFEEL